VKREGFTLLEVLVATVIMAVAVGGLLSSLTTSLGNARRLTEADRAALAARRTMDELLAAPSLPARGLLEGRFDPATGLEGWRARLNLFEAMPGATAGAVVLQRIELELWWTRAGGRRAFTLEAYRPHVLTPADTGAIAP